MPLYPPRSTPRGPDATKRKLFIFPTTPHHTSLSYHRAYTAAFA